MKKLFIAFAVALLAASSASAATIEIDAGVLRTMNGGSTVPVGGLLQLIVTPAGPSGTFGAPTATSFVSGDNVVLASFAMNNNFGTGETDNVVSFNLTTVGGTASATTIDQGDALLLRWWPTLTLTSTAPGAGTTYGQYRSDSPEALSNNTSAGIAWFAPAQTARLSAPNGLNFNTSDIPSGPPNGVNAPSAGYANFTVAAVPEPSTMWLMGGTISLLAFAQSIRRKSI